MPKVKELPSESREIAIKLAVLSLFALVIVAFGFFSNQKKAEGPAVKNPSAEPQVLSESTEKTPVQDLQNFGTTMQDGASQLAEQTQTTAQNVLGTATQNVASFVVENAGAKLLEQIQNLPAKQQEELKQQICK